MKIETKLDIGDRLLVKIDEEREELVRVIRIDIFSMDRGCYALEYTLDLLYCERDGDNVIEHHVMVPEHRIEEIEGRLVYDYSKWRR